MRLNPNALGTVPNGSERIGTGRGSEARTGRQPFLSDEALLEKARLLNQQHGRPPTAPELIDAAGGCQKQRALRCIQQLRVELAERAARSVLVLPKPLRDDLDAFAARVLDRAAEQLAEKQAQSDLDTERKVLAAREEVEQLTEQLSAVRIRLADTEHLHQELLAAQRQLRTELDEANGRAHRASAIAEERQRLLDELLKALPPTPAPAL